MDAGKRHRLDSIFRGMLRTTLGDLEERFRVIEEKVRTHPSREPVSPSFRLRSGGAEMAEVVAPGVGMIGPRRG